MQFKKIAFFTILSLLFFTGCSEKTDDKKIDNNVQKSTSYKLTSTQAQIINIKDIENGMIFENYKGKAVLVNFFATWCPPCKAEIPHLNKLREKYGNEFEIIAVLLEQNKDNIEVENFINKFEIKYPITNSDENFVLAKALGGVKSIPTMFLFNKEGKLIQKYVGIVPEEMMEIDIKRAIK